MSDTRRESLIEAAARLLQAAGGSLPITTLNKALFYLDLFALRDLGQTVTRATFVALPAGPVVAKYEARLVRALEEAGLAQQDESEDGGAKPVCLLASPTTKALSDEATALAARIGAWASRRSAGGLSDLSHLNAGWRFAWDRGLGAKKPALPINMSIAMQQVLDIDPWMDESPDAEAAAAFADADAQPGEEF
jgi:hypothetical protein